MKMYEVGGCVRDEILGVKSKDIDFSVVLDVDDLLDPPTCTSMFEIMVNNLKVMGFEIFLETPDYFTARAKFPGKGYTVVDDMFNRPYDKYKGLTADFVLARKESNYTDGRRPDGVQPGTLEDDLARRDFTMNAIAKDIDGNLIDPYNGVSDIDNGWIRCVGDPMERFNEDALRAVRALRFSVTKRFNIIGSVHEAMLHPDVHEAIVNKISDERINDELSKMFRFDTVASLFTLNQYPALTAAMFAGTVSLDSTMKTKGRGK